MISRYIKYVLALLLLTVSFDSAAEQKARPFFVGFGALSQLYKVDSGALSKKIDDIRQQPDSTHLDNSDRFNASAYAGYRFYDPLAIMLTYTDDVSFEDKDYCFLFACGENASVDLTITDLSLQYRWPLSESSKFHAFVFAGPSRLHEEVWAGAYTPANSQGLSNRDISSDNLMRAHLGIGVEIRWTAHFGARVGYTRYDYFGLNKSYFNLQWSF